MTNYIAIVDNEFAQMNKAIHSAVKLLCKIPWDDKIPQDDNEWFKTFENEYNDLKEILEELGYEIK